MNRSGRHHLLKKTAEDIHPVERWRGYLHEEDLRWTDLNSCFILNQMLCSYGQPVDPLTTRLLNTVGQMSTRVLY